MLIALASHSTRIAIAASPAPRKMALIMKSKTTEALQASQDLISSARAVALVGRKPINRIRLVGRPALEAKAMAETLIDWCVQKQRSEDMKIVE